jgi:hypothetical protein
MKIIKKNPLLFILGLMIILGICFFLAINIGSIKMAAQSYTKRLVLRELELIKYNEFNISLI